MKIAAALPLPIVVLVLAGCGSSPPAQSAPHACKDFAAWVRAQDGNNDAGTDMALLKQAVSEAPSGQLYQDLDTVQVNVTTAIKHPAYDAQQETGTDVQAVQLDCSSVNPG